MFLEEGKDRVPFRTCSFAQVTVISRRAAVLSIATAVSVRLRATAELARSKFTASLTSFTLAGSIGADDILRCFNGGLFLEEGKDRVPFRTCSIDRMTVISFRATVLSIATADSLRPRATAVDS